MCSGEVGFMLSLGGQLGRKEQEERDRKWPSISKGQGFRFSMTGMTGLVEKGYALYFIHFYIV